MKDWKACFRRKCSCSAPSRSFGHQREHRKKSRMKLLQGFTLFAGLLAASPAAAQDGLRQRIDTTMALAEGGTLSVNIYSGRVNVTGARSSGVRVRGTADRD